MGQNILGSGLFFVVYFQSHGVCIGVLDTKLKPLDERESYTPSCLLGKEVNFCNEDKWMQGGGAGGAWGQWRGEGGGC